MRTKPSSLDSWLQKTKTEDPHVVYKKETNNIFKYDWREQWFVIQTMKLETEENTPYFCKKCSP